MSSTPARTLFKAAYAAPIFQDIGPAISPIFVARIYSNPPIASATRTRFPKSQNLPFNEGFQLLHS